MSTRKIKKNGQVIKKNGRAIKKNDQVKVIAGKCRGQVGRVISFPSEETVLVSGVNIVSKTVRANPQAEEAGGIKKKEAPIHISNVMIFNPETGKADRTTFVNLEGEKVRVYKSTGKPITDRVKG